MLCKLMTLCSILGAGAGTAAMHNYSVPTDGRITSGVLTSGSYDYSVPHANEPSHQDTYEVAPQPLKNPAVTRAVAQLSIEFGVKLTYREGCLEVNGPAPADQGVVLDIYESEAQLDIYSAEPQTDVIRTSTSTSTSNSNSTSTNTNTNTRTGTSRTGDALPSYEAYDNSKDAPTYSATSNDGQTHIGSSGNGSGTSSSSGNKNARESGDVRAIGTATKEQCPSNASPAGNTTSSNDPVNASANALEAYEYMAPNQHASREASQAQAQA